MCPHKPDTLPPTPWCVYIHKVAFSPPIPIIVLKHFYWFIWSVKTVREKKKEFVQRPANCIVPLMLVKTRISWRKSLFRIYFLCVKTELNQNMTWRKTGSLIRCLWDEIKPQNIKKQRRPSGQCWGGKKRRKRKASWSCLTRSAAIETLFKKNFVRFYFLCFFQFFSYFQFFSWGTRCVIYSLSGIFLWKPGLEIWVKKTERSTPSKLFSRTALNDITPTKHDAWDVCVFEC